jgi:hypothetical protein
MMLPGTAVRLIHPANSIDRVRFFPFDIIINLHADTPFSAGISAIHLLVCKEWLTHHWNFCRQALNS